MASRAHGGSAGPGLSPPVLNPSRSKLRCGSNPPRPTALSTPRSSPLTELSPPVTSSSLHIRHLGSGFFISLRSARGVRKDALSTASRFAPWSQRLTA
ncbi:hypothetical protein AAFF_G00042380 [Aldrovandia affinis]|uniref:Uncharacterized protein n=1 Tax=Aldrovandia affinis TaxID=143900 RepID=A0AAD7S2R4_9TELE|nr:hypothetical protein AAFF_G00042380 [Aldrovandia affinis]